MRKGRRIFLTTMGVSESYIKHLLVNGVFAVNKLKDYTCMEVLEIIKDVLLKGVKPHLVPKNLKVGHGGTLDETATGVLAVGLNRGCKTVQKFIKGDKLYIVTGKLGISTDTYNETGEVTKKVPYDHVTEQMLKASLTIFHGEIFQTPPKYSALKMNGRRLSDLTRSGISIIVPPRPVTCHSLKCIEFNPPFFTLEVCCGSGFYVRSLVHDLGEVLKTCAHVTKLHRTQHGIFTEKDMLDSKDWTAENILKAIHEAKQQYSDNLECLSTKQTKKKVMR